MTTRRTSLDSYLVHTVSFYSGYQICTLSGTILPRSAVSVAEDEGDGGTSGRLRFLSALPFRRSPLAVPLGQSALLLGFAQSPLALPLGQSALLLG